MQPKLPLSLPLWAATLKVDDDLVGEDELFAFTVVDGGAPQVIRFPATENGLESLSNLIRAENVILVVRGTELRCDVESVVTLSAAGSSYQDRLPLR